VIHKLISTLIHLQFIRMLYLDTSKLTNIIN